MRGDNEVLAVTTITDEITGQVQPLFALPVQVCKAVETKEPRFDITAPSGAKRVQQYIDPTTDKVVLDAECKRGVLVGDQFSEIKPEDIEQITDAVKIDTMVVSGVVDLVDVPFDRATDFFYLQSPAKGGSPKSYKLLYEALRQTQQALVTKRTVRSKQQLLVIYADTERQALVANALRFAGTVREPDELVVAPQLAHIEQTQIDMAKKVISGLGDGHVALESDFDEGLVRRAELIEQALAGETLNVPTPVAETAATDDLSAALEASLAAVGSGA